MNESDLITEYFKSAREELLFRVKHRDSFLKLHFLVQAVLLSLSKGVTILGTRAENPISLSVHLTIPLALIFALLYYKEDRLIGQLSSYLAGLSNRVKLPVDCWDKSVALRKYIFLTVGYRFVVHLFAFCIIPIALVVMSSPSSVNICTMSCIELLWLFLQALIMLAMFAITIVECVYRSKTGK